MRPTDSTVGLLPMVLNTRLIEAALADLGHRPNLSTSMCNYLRMRAEKVLDGSPPPEEQVDLAVEVFRMLSDATRFRLLWALRNSELSVNELAVAVGRSPAGVSQHLAKLRMARLVRTRKNGTQVIYRIENSHVRQLVEDAAFHVEHATSAAVPEHHRSDPAVSPLDSTGPEHDSPEPAGALGGTRTGAR